MAKKYKYQAEFEIHCDPKRLYQYISTPSGLQSWFADRVIPINDKMYDMIWDKQSHPARIVSKRQNSHIKFQFLDPSGSEEDLNYIEFRIDYSEITQTSFLHITDYSEMTEKSDLDDLWNKLVGYLLDAIGSHIH
ncbi:MAG: START-like domain-containing protein [Cytophagales bacterium]|nr:START-like domain-containing protein [Cytophagales bacterium]MDW8384346.1 START-like domain-containing protein [Flammeovirgaceae bacterium]